MGTASGNAGGVSSTNISRRRVVAGAAWAVPAVVVASSAPAMAASPGFLTFTGDACKLPGNSQSVFKGYVFELVANNDTGADSVAVITSVTINGVNEPVYRVVASGQCTCACGADPDHDVCVPAGATNMMVLIETGTFSTSENAEMVITYQQYDCDCNEIGDPVQISSGVLSTPPVQNQNLCKVNY